MIWGDEGGVRFVSPPDAVEEDACLSLGPDRFAKQLSSAIAVGSIEIGLRGLQSTDIAIIIAQ